MAATDFPSSTPNQTTRALLELRNLILNGELAPNERLSELAVVERLGVSRTPVRAALQRLAEEGLLEEIVGGGYAVKTFTERDVYDAIELRGTLEGMAARFAAEHGASPVLLSKANEIVAAVDRIIGQAEITAEDFERYIKYNEQFHKLLIAMSGSELLAREFDRMTRLPFASPSGFVKAQVDAPQARLILTLAQEGHRAVVEAIELRQGDRAESLMREHARLAHRNLRYALANRTAIRLVHGGALIQAPVAP
ncbi:GntR family transcriptional regulator [Castellaniella sp. S9]|uniref:GntR family transcriptional regulator n=1 Tax=Castellaniella sp. S9 TaxID=2993652 RepID=UPI0022B31521|nr:GntR family transcriptional regulator [Castellaniella sp. S9]